MAKDVAWEARQLLTSIEGLTIPIDSFISDSPYLSPNVPEGFSTVYAYIAERNPDLMDFVAKPLREIYRRDERAIRALASRRKLPICNVVAPYALREEGVETVTAYPISVIRDVLY
jgi:hypothetical protein